MRMSLATYPGVMASAFGAGMLSPVSKTTKTTKTL